MARRLLLETGESGQGSREGFNMLENNLRGLQIVTSVAVLLLAIPACDESGTGSATGALGDEGRRNDVSVVRGINQPPDRDGRRPAPQRRGPDFRNIDGSDNSEGDADVGAAKTQLTRWAPPDYADGISAMAGESRPSPRAVSNAVVAQLESVPNRNGASDFLWQWGQFLDHDIDLTDAADPAEPAPIAVPAGDRFFDPSSTGAEVIPFNRSLYDKATGVSDPRQQLNEITHWIDASNVYGSEDERAAVLRSNDGTGKLLVSDGNLLPFNDEGLANAGGDSPALFVAGDVRANEQVGLTAMHTLFVREHNRLAEEIAAQGPRALGRRDLRASASDRRRADAGHHLRRVSSCASRAEGARAVPRLQPDGRSADQQFVLGRDLSSGPQHAERHAAARRFEWKRDRRRALALAQRLLRAEPHHRRRRDRAAAAGPGRAAVSANRHSSRRRCAQLPLRTARLRAVSIWQRSTSSEGATTGCPTTTRSGSRWA